MSHATPGDTPEQPSTALAFTPVPRLCERHDGWTPERQQAFIEALADYGSVRAAANSVGLAPEGAYRLRRQPGAEEFAAAWRAALDHGIQRIEDVAMDRALNGVEVPVYSYGKLVGTRRVYNDYLMMFMLRNRAPERFATDRARGMSAVDQTKLARLKRQWRAEWEAEQEAGGVSEADVRASIEQRIEALKRRVEAHTSPRAYELRLACIAQERADDAAGWRPGEPYEPYAARAAELFPACLEEVRREWPEYEPPEWPIDDGCDDDWDTPPEPAQATPEPPHLPRIRTLKDDTWR